MFRLILFILGLGLVWAIVVAGLVFVEAALYAEPNVVRGDDSSITSHLDSHLERVASDRSLGAAALALIQNGEIIFEKGYGTAYLENGTGVDAERTLFQVGSVSKAVTAFGTMKLVQDGKLGLDEPVIGRLQRWRFAGSDERSDRVTVRQLLSHTSGIDDNPGYIGFLPGERVQTIEEYLSAVRVSREPGSEFVYGNAATAILQLLIEDVTGQQFSSYMTENILNPLGMTNSTFDPDVAISRLAPAYDAGVTPQIPRRHSIPAAVALYTSGHDLGRFAIALAGANTVLNEETMRVMAEPAAATGGNWGLGLALFTANDNGGNIVGHDGGAQPAWGAMVRFNPATRNGMVVAVSGGRGAANQLSHDWVYWETGKLTTEARRQVAYGRARSAALAIIVGVILIGILGIVRHRRPKRDIIQA